MAQSTPPFVPDTLDPPLRLALAVVAASTVPLLLLDGDLTLVAASASFGAAFGLDGDLAGRSIFTLGAGEWNLPRLRALLTATASGAADVAAYEIDLARPGAGVRRLVLNAHLLSYGATGPVRLLLTVADVTDARAAEKIKDELVRDKALLVQEVQHRVANSLQIIASVLMQSARKVQSDEARGHLNDAHHRVMSIAAVQSQLAASAVGKVALDAYLTQLCASIGASMIADHDQLSIDVTVDGSTVEGDTSISLGLVVTELVINALKHAFPDARHGKIGVDYRSDGGNWTLSVRDDGVGMPPSDATPSKPGLGTSIVEALARQLHARISVADTAPGTDVSLVHVPVATTGRNDNPEPVAKRAV